MFFMALCPQDEKVSVQYTVTLCSKASQIIGGGIGGEIGGGNRKNRGKNSKKGENKKKCVTFLVK